MFINLNLKSDDKPATEAEGQGGDGSETLVSNSESSEQSVVPVTKVDTVDFLDVSSAPVHATPAPVSVAKPAEQFDLFDLMGSVSTPASHSGTPSIQLIARPSIDPPVFQSKWMSLPVAATVKLTIKDQHAAASIENLLASASIQTMASGTVNGLTKLYSFAQEASSSKFFLLEIIITLATGSLTATIKSELTDSIALFQQKFVSSIQSVLL